MDDRQKVLEVERAVNLLRGFGWDRLEESVEGDQIRLTFEKTLESPLVSESQG